MAMSLPPVFNPKFFIFLNKGQNTMTSKTFTAPNISCGHCIRTIETELGDLTGIKNVKAEVESKQVTVEWVAPASWDEIKDLLVEIGFPPAE
jgi:copper chaperone CopZ